MTQKAFAATQSIRCPHCGAPPGVLCRSNKNVRASQLRKFYICRERRLGYVSLVDSYTRDSHSDISISPVINSNVILSPVDKPAALVTSTAPRWERVSKAWRGAGPIPLRPIPSDMPNMIGRAFGFLTVIGLSKHCGKNGVGGAAAWLCRCACGYYVLRTSKAINHGNDQSACEICYKTRRSAKAASDTDRTDQPRC